MNTVWVLIAIVANGHFGHYVIPTLEFKTETKCQSAIMSFANDTRGKGGNTDFMRCVKIEK
jgi:hypothetical protein